MTDSSISKADGESSKKEDGLGVLVYVNNTRIGSSAAVSTDGSLASFDRSLGQLNVGDTVWVMIDPLKNQLFDAFSQFDFSIQKSVPIVQATSLALLSTDAVPEPSAALLAFIALCGATGGRTRRWVPR